MASSSSSSSPDFSRPCPKNGCYDVFLSFRGKDTRRGFTYNLYHSFMEKEVYTFMDVKLVGKTIDSLFKIIGKSKMAVVVYSERFASSDWCLKELDTILQRVKDEKMMMLPIFYKVKVDELKHLTGNTGKYLEELISDHGETNVQKWKTAITTLGHVSGLSFGDSYERVFISEVIKTVKEMLEEWEEPVGSSIRPHYSGPTMELHNLTELDFIQRFEEMSTILKRLYEKESTGNQQPQVLAKEENTQALGVQTEVDDAEVELGVNGMEEEVLSSNDQQQQAYEIDKGLASDKNIEKGLEVHQEDAGSSMQSFAHTNTTLGEKSREFTGELISIEPSDLRFWIEPEKQSSTCLILSNKTDNYVAFKLKMDTKKPQNYSIHPNKGLLQPRSTRQVIVTMEAQTELLPSLLGEMSKDKFLIQSVKASYSTNDFPNMFTESGNTIIDKFEMAVFYFAPPPRDSSVQDHRAQLADIEKDLACDKNIEKGLKVPQEDKCSSTGEEEVYRIVTSAYFQKSATISRGELIDIEPGYLIFYVEPEKPSSSWLTLTNKTDKHVAFMLKMDTEKQLNYSIHPNKGVLLPRSRCQIQVTMEAQTVLPSHEEIKDKFLIQCVKAKKDSYSTNDFSNLFTGMLSRFSVDEFARSVLYIAPTPGDSPVPNPLGQLLANKGLLHECMYVYSIDTHPTKPWVLLAFYYGVVSIWNYETRAEEKSFIFNDWGAGYASFIHEKHWIVVGGSEQGFVLVFNYNTSEKVKEFKAHEDFLRCIKVHPTSPYALTASCDKLVKLWNWENDWVCSETFKGHSNAVRDVAFNPKDSRSFVSASMDGTIKIWSFGSSFAKFTINAHARGLMSVQYFVGNDNKLYLLSGSFDNTVRVWDYESRTLVQTLEGHSNILRKILVHPKLPVIITGSEDKTIRIWNKDTYRLNLVWTCDFGEVYSIGFIQASDEVVLGCEQGMVVIKIVDAAGTRSD